jgi:Pyridoxamine 5'-phosphate oxidase
VDVTNLDRYGDPELPWSRARDALAEAPSGPEITFFLGTSRPDGRPHAAGVGALREEGELYFTNGARTRKARNLAANPACTISVKLEGIDLVLEGEATRVTDTKTLERLAGRYRDGGWPAEVDGTRSRPRSAPRAPGRHRGSSTAWRCRPHSGSRPPSRTARPAGASGRPPSTVPSRPGQEEVEQVNALPQ